MYWYLDGGFKITTIRNYEPLIFGFSLWVIVNMYRYRKSNISNLIHIGRQCLPVYMYLFKITNTRTHADLNFCLNLFFTIFLMSKTINIFGLFFVSKS